MLFTPLLQRLTPFVIHICTNISIKYLENETNEDLCWDSELFHGLETTKLLVSKLKKRNQNIYQAYCMINKVLINLRDVQSNIDTEFKVQFNFSVDRAKSGQLDAGAAIS